MFMKSIIFTEKAPKPIGPYSQAVLINNLLFISGQIAINPLTGELIKGNIKEQTIQVMNNIKEILTKAGYDLNDVVKVSVILTDISRFSEVNQVYAEFFTQDTPAREILQAVALPLGAQIEISAIAAK